MARNSPASAPPSAFDSQGPPRHEPLPERGIQLFFSQHTCWGDPTKLPGLPDSGTDGDSSAHPPAIVEAPVESARLRHPPQRMGQP